jgi:hypothetical protein
MIGLHCRLIHIYLNYLLLTYLPTYLSRYLLTFLRTHLLTHLLTQLINYSLICFNGYTHTSLALIYASGLP